MTENEAVAELPGDAVREGIVADLRRRLGDAVLDTELLPQRDLWVRVSTDSWLATGQAFKELGFTYFCFLSAIDWKPSPWGRGEDDPTQPPPERTTAVVQGVAGGETRFQLLARVVDPVRHVGVTLKADVPEGDDGALTMPSWHTVYAGANWHERETHEMFGIGFEGHPDLRNMYLPGDFEGFPLRKDFPLLARMVKPWPGIVDVEPMPEAEDPAENLVDETAGAPAAEAAPAEAPADEAATDEAAAAEGAEAPAAEAPAEEAAEAPESAADPAEATTATADDAPDPEPAPESEPVAETEAAPESEPTAEAEPVADAEPVTETPDEEPASDD